MCALRSVRKILFIHNSSELGGGSGAFLDIVKAVREHSKYEPIVLLRSPGKIGKDLHKWGIKTYFAKFSQLPCCEFSPMTLSLNSVIRIVKFVILFPLTVRIMHHILDENDVDVIYLNTSVMISCGIIAKIYRKPVITHIREVPYINAFGKLLLKLHEQVSDLIICNSLATKKRSDLIIRESILIYDWVDLKRFYPSDVKTAKTKIGIAADKICIGMANQLSRAKGVFVLLEAAFLLLKKELDVVFLFVGGFARKDEEYDFWEQINKSEYSSHFVTTGWVRNPECYLAAMDIIVVPNIKAEGFGKSVIEAQAMNKPLIVSNVGPASELVQDGKTAILIEPNDPEVLAETITYLLDNPDTRKRLEKNGRNFVSHRFGLEQGTKKIVSIIDGMLNPSREG